MSAFTTPCPARLSSRRCHTSTSSRRMPRASLQPATQTAFASLLPTPEQSTVLTPQGTHVSLVDHVSSKNAQGEAVLLGWLRHFGCTLCKKQANDWKSMLPRLRERTLVNVVLVGNGSASQAREFQKEINWEGDLFTDPDRRTYRALKMKAGVLTTLNLPSLKTVIRSFRHGNKQTWSRIPTDAFQQGGALLVDNEGIVRMFHADDFAGDHVSKERLVAEVSKLAINGQASSL
ncbi:Thioredoxin [Gracilaria domingensis]|nr:Thioredoxin [Gracilaria domingensis]